MSLLEATSRALLASVGPCLIRLSIGWRFLCPSTVRLWPLVTMFLPMPWPISPAPIKPTRFFSAISQLLNCNCHTRLGGDYAPAGRPVEGECDAGVMPDTALLQL